MSESADEWSGSESPGIVPSGAGLTGGRAVGGTFLKAVPMPRSGPSIPVFLLGLGLSGFFFAPAITLLVVLRQTPDAVMARQIERLALSQERLAEKAAQPRCTGLCIGRFDWPAEEQPRPQPQPFTTAPAPQSISLAEIDENQARAIIVELWNRAAAGEVEADRAYWTAARAWYASAESGSYEPYAIAFAQFWREVPEAKP